MSLKHDQGKRHYDWTTKHKSKSNGQRTRADDDSLNLLVRSHLRGNLGNESLEVGLADHLGKVGSGVGVSEEVLGEEENKLVERY